MARSCLSCVQAVSAAAFEYDTVKLVSIRNQKIGFVYRLVQLAVVGYIIGYVIIYKKGYQETDLVVSSVTTKMKGTAMTNYSARPLWDVADYVVPPAENNAVFVTTNAIITRDQVQGICPESTKNSNCTKDDECPENTYVEYGNGFRNGSCDTHTGSCFIYAWCPVENDTTPRVYGVIFSCCLPDSQYCCVYVQTASRRCPKELHNAHQEQHSVPEVQLLQVTVTVCTTSGHCSVYTSFRRNILDRTDKTFLKNCTFNKNDHLGQFCPIFVLSQVVKDSGADWEDLTTDGGVVGIFIKWNCDLDRGYSDCTPQYSFRRLDRSDSKLASGYNFRYPIYFKEGTEMHRTLVKAYGIRFQIIVSGKAGKFSIVPLLLNIGSGIALLGIATVICDFIVMYIVKRRSYYKDKKYQLVEDREALFEADGYDELATTEQSEKDSLNRSGDDSKLYTE